MRLTVYKKDNLPTYEQEATRLIAEYFNQPVLWKRTIKNLKHQPNSGKIYIMLRKKLRDMGVKV